jgi:putative acetyltransferase
MTDDTPIAIREERASDAAQVRDVVSAAFGRQAEATLVEQLRAEDGVFAFVALEGPVVVGHIMFSPVTSSPTKTRDPRAKPFGIGLAPLAVRPDRQRQGVGAALMRHGLAACASRGAGLVVVLGSPRYYPKFGFTSATLAGLKCRWPVPDGTFMCLELKPTPIALTGGFVHYHAAFDVF